MTTNKKTASEPLFRNRTKIEQLFYDESYSPVIVPPGKTIRGEWYRKHAGKNKPLVLVSKELNEESDEVKTKDDIEQGPIDSKDQG